MRRQSPSGLAATPTLKWGSHLGQVYETADDLKRTLVPYFRAGLENNERCFWVTGAPLRAEQARDALRAVVPDLDDREDAGQIEIKDGDTWYVPGAPLDPKSLIADLLRREEDALDEGYEGLRTNGNCAWVQQAHWADFQTYESMVTDAVRGRRLICMCSYCFDGKDAHALLDVVERHDLLLPRHSPSADDQDALAAGAEMFVGMMESLPAAIYTTDKDGFLSYYNKAASDLWGYEPEIAVDRWCGMAKLFRPDGALIPHEESPMALAVGTASSLQSIEVIGERTDGVRVPVTMSPTPLFNGQGKVIGAINVMIDISAQRMAEDRYKTLALEMAHRVNNTLATVQAIASSTMRCSGTIEDFHQTFTGRIRALSKTSLHVMQGGTADVSLRDLLESELKAFSDADDPRIALAGEDLMVPEPLVGPVGMAIHELATNAVKYGALSPRGGKLSIEWTTSAEGIEIRWREHNVPLMGEASRSGFGTQLLTEILPRQINADIEIRYAPDGVNARLRIPT